MRDLIGSYDEKNNGEVTDICYPSSVEFGLSYK